MKNTFTSIALILAIVCVSQIWAQEAIESESAVEAQVEMVEESVLEVEKAAERATELASESESIPKEPRIKLDLDFDGNSRADEKDKLKRLVTVIREVAGEDVANEVIVELDGLSEEEKQEFRESLADGFAVDHIPGWVGAVAILAVLLFVGAPIWILMVVFIFGARKRKQKMELIQMYLDSDKNVPPQVLATFGQSGSSFRSGIMFSAVGLGILAAFGAAGNDSAGALGLIPLFIGIAKLIYWFIEERKYESS